MTDLATIDYTTDSSLTGPEADYSGDWSGAGGSPGATCDYQPYCIDANAAVPDTVILATTPFSYYLMDANGGVDATGNGHTAISSIGTVTYGVASLTSKVPANTATRYTNGGSIRFPPPVANLTNPATPWATCMVLQVDAYDAGVGGSGPFSFVSWSDAQPPKFGPYVATPGYLIGWCDSTFSRLGTFSASKDPLFATGEPHVLVINMEPVVGGASCANFSFWVDGVRVITLPTDNSGVDGAVFSIGRLPGGGPFFGAINMTYSNFATWARTLTDAEIKTISEALVDDAILATSWVPTP